MMQRALSCSVIQAEKSCNAVKTQDYFDELFGDFDDLSLQDDESCKETVSPAPPASKEKTPAPAKTDPVVPSEAKTPTAKKPAGLTMDSLMPGRMRMRPAASQPEKKEAPAARRTLFANVRYEPPVIEKSDFAKEHTPEELEEYALQRLQTISQSHEMEEMLYPLCRQALAGYSAILTGDPKGPKYLFLNELSSMLWHVGKVSQPDPCRLSFSQISGPLKSDRVYVISDLTDACNTLSRADELTDNSGGDDMQSRYVKKLHYLLHARSTCYIFIDATETERKDFLLLDPKIPYLFSTQITFTDMSDREIFDLYQMALPPLQQSMVTASFERRMLDYLSTERRYFPFNNQELAEYLAAYSSRSADRLELPPPRYSELNLEKAFSKIIGLDAVKKQIYGLAEYLSAQKTLNKIGITMPPFNLHMLFLGNPGVGKTTMARIVAKLLFNLGYIQEDKLIEVSPKDLMANTPALTGVKTSRVISRAMGGVLFVDEAYSLATGGAPGEEAAALLVKAMEDHRTEFVCMFAGYTLEMHDFLHLNSGIESRIQFKFTFDDYTEDELFEIYRLKLEATGMSLDSSARQAAIQVMHSAKTFKNFGNGRFAEKMVQRTLVKHVNREDFSRMSANQMALIDKNSVPDAAEIAADMQ